MQTFLNYYLDGAIDVYSKTSDIFMGYILISYVFLSLLLFSLLLKDSVELITLWKECWVAKLRGQQNALFFELRSLLRKLGYVYMKFPLKSSK